MTHGGNYESHLAEVLAPGVWDDDNDLLVKPTLDEEEAGLREYKE